METKNTEDEKKSNSDEKPKLFIEAESGHEKGGHGPKNVYTRKEMEALRFVSAEEQSSKWLEVYCGLGPDVARAYDAMADFNTTQKQNYVDFDPRRFQKSKAASAILGKEFYDNMDIQIHSTYGGGYLDGSTVSEEECSEEDDSSAGYNSILKPAFEVSGQPNFDSGPPQDGLEFIRRVRWEAERIPNVTVAKAKSSKTKNEQTVYMPRIPDIAKCPEHSMPLKQWEDTFLADFSELSLALSHHIGSCAEVSGEHELMPDVHEEGCCYQLFDSLNQEKIDDSVTDAADENDASLSSSSGGSEDGPILSAILGMDSVARASMLKKRINLVETMSSLSRGDCAWLFALCAAVDTPLDADTSAAIRSLLRKCASLRAEKSELDDEVVMLNILATISGRYFRQSEGFHA